MKSVIKFSKLFIPCIILSVLLMIFSIVGLFYKGINFGLDFQAGFIEKILIAPTAFTLTYDGAKTVNISLSSKGLDITSTAVDEDSEAMSFMDKDYATVGAFVEKLKDFDGIKIDLVNVDSSTPFVNLFIDSQILPRLSNNPFEFH